MTCKLKLEYKEAVDYFRSAVSYLSELMKEDKRTTTQWMHVIRSLDKNITRFYKGHVLVVGSKTEQEEFKNYVEKISSFTKKKSSQKTEESGKTDPGQDQSHREGQDN